MRNPLAVGLILLTIPAVCPAASKEIVQLQRDIALLDDRVRTLQSSLDERMGALLAVQQLTLRRVNQLNTSTAVSQNAVGEQLKQQAKSFSTPMTAVAANLNQVKSEVQSLRESLAEINAKLGNLDQKLVDLDNAVRIIQAPPSPPSGSPAPAPAGTR